MELGSEVPADEVKVGELRWSFMRGGMSEESGAFAECVFFSLSDDEDA